MPTFLDAAVTVLKHASEPLHYRAITERALADGLVHTQGKTPADTMNAQISVSIKSKGAASRFVRVRPGVYGLRVWLDDGRLSSVMDAHEPRYTVTSYRGLTDLRGALRSWDGLSAEHLQAMRQQIEDVVQSSTERIDWSNPPEWIPARLHGPAADLASTMWRNGAQPRYPEQSKRMALAYGLLAESDVFSLTDAGRDLLSNPLGETTALIDRAEGILACLEWIAEQGPVATAELMAPWSDWLQRIGRQPSENTRSLALRTRIADLLERDLVAREGRSWRITEAGLSWLRQAGDIDPDSGEDERQSIRELADSQRREVREALSAALSEMNPYAFEELISRLLDRMGYLDAEVTSPSNDKGVDVVAKVEFGITSITEVVQVKRQKANVGRPVLDGLRGSLYRFAAQRGTIITTSGFSKGAKEAALHAGAAPITLIDGEKLVELLVRHELGIRKKNIEVWELDESTLTVDEVEE